MSVFDAPVTQEVEGDPEIAEVADRLFELVIRLRPPRPRHRSGDEDGEERDAHRERHGQMRMLITLFHEGPSTMQDLARALDVSAPTASVMAKKSFEEGWVERRRDGGDSRIVWLDLTSAGRERVRAHRAERVRKLQRMIEERTDLDRAEIDGAIDVLTRLFSPALSVERPESTGAGQGPSRSSPDDGDQRHRPSETAEPVRSGEERA